MIYKILRLFDNTLTADGKHYLLNKDNLTQPIQMHLSQKQKSFLNFFLHSQNLYSILKIFQKKMTLIADAVPELPASKNMIR